MRGLKEPELGWDIQEYYVRYFISSHSNWK